MRRKVGNPSDVSEWPTATLGTILPHYFSRRKKLVRRGPGLGRQLEQRGDADARVGYPVFPSLTALIARSSPSPAPRRASPLLRATCFFVLSIY